jgi:hypothetical protein
MWQQSNSEFFAFELSVNNRLIGCRAAVQRLGVRRRVFGGFRVLQPYIRDLG